MKKITFELISQILFGIAGVALMLGGAIMFIGSFFTNFSLSTSIIFMVLGAILFTGVKLYFMFLEVLTAANKQVDEINKGISPQNHNSRTYPGVTNITIDENTTMEDIEEIKKKFPPLSNIIDNVIKNTGTIDNDAFYKETLPKHIELLSLKQLEKALEEAVENSEFEKAAEIRDEINKRKV